MGGSPDPIVLSIDDFEPEEIIFICSSRSRSEVAKIAEKTKYDIKEIFQIITVEADNPNNIHDECSTLLIKYFNIGSNILADYTGGTKSMSIGLASAASYLGVPLRFMGGLREDLIQVTPDTNQPLEFNFLWIDYGVAVDMFNNGYYASAEKIFTKVSNNSSYFKLKEKSEINKKIAKGFYLWDIFEHKPALNMLKHFTEKYPNLLFILRRIVNGQSESRYHGNELIFDLLANAKRRAVHQQYDDACGRLYRAVELLAQRRLLLQYGLNTSNLDIKSSAIPRSYKPPESNSKGIVQISRSDSYELLRHLKDKVGDRYLKHKDSIDNNMIIRNNSILAHGNEAVSAVDFRTFSLAVEKFIKEAISAIGVSFELVEFPKID